MNMSSKTFRIALKLLPLILAAAFIIDAVINEEFSWKPMRESKHFKELFEAPITKMTIYDNTESIEWAVFEDRDLIDKWYEYFDSVRVNPRNRVRTFFGMLPGSCVNGAWGNPIAVCTVGEKDIYLVFYSNILWVNGREFDITAEIGSPYRETFDAAVERYGIYDPWHGFDTISN